MSKSLEHSAENTRCLRKTGYGHYRCGGALFRPGDGADRLSERMGRIVVQCDRCGERTSLPVSKEEQP